MTTTKTSLTKKTVAKKTRSAKPDTNSAKKTRKISVAERYKMIEVAAYYIAENNHFKGNTIDFWTAAETELDKKLIH